jgi:hypothetical protein
MILIPGGLRPLCAVGSRWLPVPQRRKMGSNSDSAATPAETGLPIFASPPAKDGAKIVSLQSAF